jgi:ectoine hydroxylase
MRWSDEQVRQFREQGFLCCPGLLSAEVEKLKAPLPALLAGKEEEDHMHRERERSGAIRQVYLAHRYCESYRSLIRDPRLLDPVKQLLAGEVYIFHSKINVKEPFEGTVWLWHQDYGYWHHDGVNPRLISVMVLLDRATLNNGCLMFAAGSHRWGRLHHEADTVTTSYRQWCVPTTVLEQHLKEEMIQPITGEAGDVVFFDCQLLHASGHNLSPLPRKVFIAAYNAIDNKPGPVENPRPDWVVARQFDVVCSEPEA